jgi:GNAT superfamily N-acetyltransferase
MRGDPDPIGPDVMARPRSGSAYARDMQVTYEWRGVFANPEINDLHAEGFGHEPQDADWRRRVEDHSLGWVCARDPSGALVGFVNVPWDGATHAFVLDTLVAVSARRRGIAMRMIELVVEGARSAGCAWLHADFDEELAPFYEACGFRPTPAGLIEL